MLILAATPSDADSQPPFFAAMLIVAGIVLIALLLAVSMRNRIARRQAARPSAQEQLAEIKAAAARQGVRQRADDDDGTAGPPLDAARQLAAMLDNKAERLELLLEEAEVVIRRMEELIDEQWRAAPPNAELDSPPETPAFQAASAAPAEHRSGLDPFTRTVYELADQGRSPVEIARVLDEQTGKIELILALRQI